MSEKYNHQKGSHEYHHPNHEHTVHHPEQAKHHETFLQPEKTIQSSEELHKTIERHALSKEAHHIDKEEHSHHERSHHYITKTVKRGVYTHTIKNVQTHLKPSERAFSKIIHNDTVETLSELGADTIARPSAILGGGAVMVFGGLALLFLARHYGFVIPLSSLLALYVVGFVLLFAIDLLSKPLRKRSQRRE